MVITLDQVLTIIKMQTLLLKQDHQLGNLEKRLDVNIKILIDLMDQELMMIIKSLEMEPKLTTLELSEKINLMQILDLVIIITKTLMILFIKEILNGHLKTILEDLFINLIQIMGLELMTSIEISAIILIIFHGDTELKNVNQIHQDQVLISMKEQMIRFIRLIQLGN